MARFGGRELAQGLLGFCVAAEAKRELGACELVLALEGERDLAPRLQVLERDPELLGQQAEPPKQLAYPKPMLSEPEPQAVDRDKVRSLANGPPPELFGPKAATLGRLWHVLKPQVPEGFCVSPDADLHAPAIERAVAAAVGDIVSGGAPVIVRSSALTEDFLPFSFAGRFDSIRNNFDVAAVIEAITAVRDSANNPRVQEYLEESGIVEPPRVACIVQRQIRPTYAGALFSSSPLDPQRILLEYTDGDSSLMLRGLTTGKAFHLTRSPKGLVAHSLNARGPAMIPVPVDELVDLLDKAGAVLGPGVQNIEWCAEHDSGDWRLHIVQARLISPTEGSPVLTDFGPAPAALPAFPAFPDGTKAFAAMFFARLELGPPKLITIRRKQSEDDIANALNAYEPGAAGSVIRFSSPDNAIGLVRAFVAPDDNLAVRYFEARGQEEARGHEKRGDLFGIVHHYMPPDHSFEAYLDHEFLVIEHVPGIWEADSMLQPDLFVFEHGERAVVHKYVKTRTATLERPHFTVTLDVDPLSDSVLEAWSTEFSDTFRRIRRELPRRVPLPVNIHFIGSREGAPESRGYRGGLREDGLTLSFLNLRLAPRLRLDAPKTSAFHVVNSVRDLDAWDGHVALLLRVTVDRGNERQALVPMARRIRELAREASPEAERPVVFAEFGILSHPSLVLREFGVDVMPLHTNHEVIVLGHEAW